MSNEHILPNIKKIKFQTIDTFNHGFERSYIELLSDSSLGVFYRRYLKRYAIFRYIAYKLRLIIHASSFVLPFSHKIRNNPSYKLQKISTYYDHSNINRYEISGKVECVLPDPLVINEYELSLISVSVSNEFPPIYLYELKNALCLPKSNIVFCGHYAVHHNMYDFNADYTSEELHGRVKILPKEKLLFINAISLEKAAELELAATFLDACSGNYAHWLSEVLPKISIFCSLENLKHVPILIDAELHINLIESLTHCIDADRQVLIVRRGIPINVKKLYFIDAVGYVPFGQRKDSYEFYHSHGNFHPLGLLSINKSISKSIELKTNSVHPHLIYIRRRNAIRKLLNDHEIEHSLHQRGFVSVDPSSMSFIEQYETFKNASVVVGATGAALANCIFCQPGTFVLALMGRHPEMIYSYWYKLLSVLKINVGIVFGDIESGNLDGIHGNFSVSLVDVNNLLNKYGVKK